ncbi:hypothetical protein PLESTB_001903100, partial [Pleodorina starrii]
MAIHILPSWNEETGEASFTWRIFSGDSAALFALLAGVGLALTSGGSHPHEGKAMTADGSAWRCDTGRAGLPAGGAVDRETLMPEDRPGGTTFLIYYGVFFPAGNPLPCTPGR